MVHWPGERIPESDLGLCNAEQGIVDRVVVLERLHRVLKGIHSDQRVSRVGLEIESRWYGLDIVQQDVVHRHSVAKEILRDVAER